MKVRSVTAGHSPSGSYPRYVVFHDSVSGPLSVTTPLGSIAVKPASTTKKFAEGMRIRLVSDGDVHVVDSATSNIVDHNEQSLVLYTAKQVDYILLFL
ncbi:hypothetical protein GEMRC1_008225 [Eukaryota sp. GEM-RC1]